MSREQIISYIDKIYQEVKDNIAELYLFAMHTEKSRTEAIKISEELEKEFQDALGSIKNNPNKLGRFPHSQNLLCNMTLITSFVYFEEMIKNYLYCWFSLYPNLLASKDITDNNIVNEKILTYSDIIENRENIIEFIIQKELFKVGHLSIDKVAKYYKCKVNGISFNTISKWDELKSGYYIRNDIVHNANAISKNTANNIKEHNEGDIFLLSFHEIYDSNDGILQINELIYSTFTEKLS